MFSCWHNRWWPPEGTKTWPIESFHRSIGRVIPYSELRGVYAWSTSGVFVGRAKDSEVYSLRRRDPWVVFSWGEQRTANPTGSRAWTAASFPREKDELAVLMRSIPNTDARMVKPWSEKSSSLLLCSQILPLPSCQGVISTKKPERRETQHVQSETV